MLMFVQFFSVFTYLAGVIWFILLSHPQFHARCYFSENALSPGLVHSQFASSNNEIARFNRYFTGDTEYCALNLYHKVYLQTDNNSCNFIVPLKILCLNM